MLLCLERPVEQHFRHPGGPHDVDDAGFGVAALGEQPGGAVEELLLALGPLRRQPALVIHRTEWTTCLTSGSMWSERRDMAAGNRRERLESHERNPKWQIAPFIIDMSICINCDTCIRHCPTQFGAIFNHGIDVIIIPELCSGCGKCLPPVCPVDCILPDPEWKPAPQEW